MKIKKRIEWSGTPLEYFEKNKDDLLKTAFTSRTLISLFSHKDLIYRRCIDNMVLKEMIILTQKNVNLNIYYQNKQVNARFIVNIGNIHTTNNWDFYPDTWININIYHDDIFIQYINHQELSPPKKYLDKTRKKLLNIFFKFI
jgi:hypothetical protein